MSAITESADDFYGVIVRQSGYGAAARAGGMMLGFLIALVLARFFGAEAYGEYKLVMALCNILLAFSIGGFGSAVNKYVPIHAEQGRPDLVWLVIRYAYSRGLIGGILIGGLLFALRHPLAERVFEMPLLARGFAIGAILILVETYFRISSSLFAARRIPALSIFHGDITSRVVFLCGLGLLIFWDRLASWHILAAYVAGETAILFFLWLHRAKLNLPPLAWVENQQERRHARREVLSFSITMMMSGFLGMILHRVDTLMLGLFREASEIGVYAVAARLCGLSSLISFACARMVTSATASLIGRNDQSGLIQLARSVTIWFTTLILPFWITTLFFAEAMMGLFGDEYRAGADALRLLVSAALVHVLTFMSGPVLLGTGGYERRLFVSSLCMVILNIALNLYLIPRAGILGAAWATLIAQAGGSMMWMYYAWSRIGINVISLRLAGLIVHGVIGVAMAWMLSRVSTHLIMGIATGVILQLLFVVLTMTMGGRAREIFMDLVRKEWKRWRPS